MAKQAKADEFAIRHMFEYVNTSYRVSPEQGHIADTSANYETVKGTTNPTTFRSCLDQQGYSYDYLVSAVTPSPGWVDQGGTNAVPQGRVYVVTVQVTTTDTRTGLLRLDNTSMHATVLPDGSAKDFQTCT